MDRNDWNARYAGTELIWSAEPNRFLVAEVVGLPVGRALEQGWGVTAVDFSDAAFAKAAALADARGVSLTLVEADVTDYAPTPGSYDLVLVAYLHLPEPERSEVIRRASVAVANEGTLLVIGHDASNLTVGYGGPQDAAVLATPAEIVAVITGLEIERAETVERTVPTPDGDRVAIDQLIRARRPA
jgi:hypothetical protein